jgi:DNA-binding NarL/FixJ family response regulator
MLVPTRKTVFIVDAMAFRRARAESFLAPWAANEKVELISLDPDEAHARLVERNECDMLIYSVGASSAYEIFTEIQVLHTLRRQAALAIVSDDENPATVIAAMRSGAQGYFSNSMPPDLALQALSFVLHGGTYFPPTAIMASHAVGRGFAPESRQQELFNEQPIPDGEQRDQASTLGPDDGIYERPPSTLFDRKAASLRLGHGSNGVRPAPEFTERQYAVLTCLCLGDPNKVIGRKLGMTETTVKVHVREIMRKLGVCNRTQVAIAAGRNGTGVGTDGVVEIIPLESTATVKSPPPHKLTMNS